MKDIHDRQYKLIFSNPIFVEKLLTSFVHEDFIKYLDFTRMTKKSNSYITDKMKKFESDIVYEIYYKDSPVYIYLLMEFQSTSDNKMPIRFLRYILQLYEDNGRNKKTGLYPAIFPLLLYNGEKKWTAKSNISDIIEYTLPSKYIPNYEYYPILINQIDKKTLLNIHNAVSAIFYMENTEVSGYHEAISDLVSIIKDSNIIEAKVFANWVNNLLLHHDKELTTQEFNMIKKSEEVLPMLAASLERYEEELIKKGLKQGLEQGQLIERQKIAKNLILAGTELEFVSKITDFTVDELQKLE